MTSERRLWVPLLLDVWAINGTGDASLFLISKTNQTLVKQATGELKMKGIRLN